MNTFIPRLISPKVEKAHKYYPVIVITGPRQSGKSTLCRNHENIHFWVWYAWSYSSNFAAD